MTKTNIKFIRKKLALAKILWKHHRIYSPRTDDWTAQPAEWEDQSTEVRDLYIEHAEQLLLTMKISGYKFKRNKKLAAI